MRVPTNSFDAADKALCRAHGRAVFEEAKDPVGDAEHEQFRARVVRFEAILAFQEGVCMPADLPLPPSYDADLAEWLYELGLYEAHHQDMVDAMLPGTGDAYVSAKQPEPAADVWHIEAPRVAGVYMASTMCDGGSVR